MADNTTTTIPAALTGPDYPAAAVDLNIIPINNTPLVTVAPDRVLGGMRHYSRGYYMSPELGTAVVIPSAIENASSGAQLSGFNPHGPQRQVIVDTSNGINVLGEIMTQGDPDRGKPGGHAAPPMHEVLPKINPTLPAEPAPDSTSTHTSTGKLVPASIPLSLDDNYDETQHLLAEEMRMTEMNATTRPVLSTKNPDMQVVGKGPSHSAQRHPRQQATFTVGNMQMPVRYHEIIIKGMSLVLIYDHHYTMAPPPPTFEPNEPEQPFRIKITSVPGSANEPPKTVQLVCHYYGISYEDELQREHTVFTIDPQAAETLNPGMSQDGHDQGRLGQIG
jgi:hypothetical protein